MPAVVRPSLQPWHVEENSLVDFKPCGLLVVIVLDFLPLLGLPNLFLRQLPGFIHFLHQSRRERSDHVEMSEIRRSQLNHARIIDEMSIHRWMTKSWLDMRIGRTEFSHPTHRASNQHSPARPRRRRGRALTPKVVARLARDTLERLSGVVIAKFKL